MTYKIFPILLLAFGLPLGAVANDKAESESYIDVGGAVLTRPDYVGSEDYQTNLLPYIGFQDLYGFDLSGLRLSRTFFEAGTGRGPGTWSLEAGPSLGFDFGRDSDDSPTLEGLADIDASALLGGYVRSTIGIIGFDISAAQDVIGGHDGFITDLSVGTRYPGKGWYVQPIATLSWGDSNYTQSIYGISWEQAEASNLSAFDTKSGFHQASVTLLGGVDIDENWSLTGVVSYREALGDYRDSPIITASDGSASGMFATLGIARRFDLN